MHLKQKSAALNYSKPNPSKTMFFPVPHNVTLQVKRLKVNFTGTSE